jgi:hypothetical protein
MMMMFGGVAANYRTGMRMLARRINEVNWLLAFMEVNVRNRLRYAELNTYWQIFPVICKLFF